MSYTVTFFALGATDFADKLQSSQSELIRKVEERAREQLGAAPTEEDLKDLRVLLDGAECTCSDELLSDSHPLHDSAMLWLADAVGAERVPFCKLQEFRHLSYLEETGIWDWLTHFPAPFPVPVCSDPPPAVGFLSRSRIIEILERDFDLLPETSDRDVDNARDDFQFLLETLRDDGLDLLAVLD